MKQIIQNLKNGKTSLVEIPCPEVSKGHILIKTNTTLVSLGTERMLVGFGNASYIEKARQQPEKVKMVLDKIKSDGVLPTIDSIRNKLDQPIALGYSNAGRVIAVGSDVTDIKVGDRVVSNGGHSEIVSVPKNLVAVIPDTVTDAEASFTVVGSIALQGIRLSKPLMGDTYVVFGLGLIGLITADLLLAQGCKVIGLDLDKSKLQLAQQKGVITINSESNGNPVDQIVQLTNGIGVDAVIITASSKSDGIISDAAKMCRKRGRIVLVGVIGLGLNRADFYEKELTFQVSCSYGPGRYDPEYEEKGNDYPISYVRWTANRNFQAVLESIRSGRIDVMPLISEKVKLENFQSIYNKIEKSNAIASLIEFEENVNTDRTLKISQRSYSKLESSVCIGIVGAGNFSKSVVLPALRSAGAKIKYIASGSGLSSTLLAKKFGVEYSTSDYHEILKDPEANLVIISTRHNLHAKQVMESMKAGKHVFVEKPLCLNHSELDLIIETYQSGQSQLTVGYNRRCSPHFIKIKSLLKDVVTPINFVATMNAGHIPQTSWVHDLETGGGRLLGEACHLIDLAIFVTGSLVAKVCINPLGNSPSYNSDNASILLKHKNGSVSTINYFSIGSKAYQKERYEIHYLNKTLILDNFKKLSGFGTKGFSTKRTKLDKGHNFQFRALIEHLVDGKKPLITFKEIVNSSRASLNLLDSMKKGTWVEVVH